MADSKKAKPKGKDKGKDKKKGKGKGEAPDQGMLSIASDPRAGAQVRRAKGWGGLIAFVLAGYLSIKANVPIADAGLRALIAGLAGYLLAWACSVTIWRQLLTAQVKHAVEESNERRRQAAASAAASAGPTIAPRE
jgi:hypothetical protein